MRYTVAAKDGGYRIEDNEAERDTPARFLDPKYALRTEAQDRARQLNRECEEADDD